MRCFREPKKVSVRLLVYKAYKLGRESAARGTVEDDDRSIRSCVATLKDSPPTAEILQRRVFYTLFLAELHRLSDPVADRLAAVQDCEQLECLGFSNPFPLYMQIIARTTRVPTTGNFGDRTVPAMELIQDSTFYKDSSGNVVTVDLTASALELSWREIAQARREIAQFQTLSE